MGFGRSLRTDPIMGGIVAVAITSRCDCVVDLVVSLCQLCLRINCWSHCVQCIWIESAESTPRSAGAHRHAARIRDFSHRSVHLEKNPKEGRMETARASLHVRVTHGRDADQGADCLCLPASWHCVVSIALPRRRFESTTRQNLQ